MKIRTEKDIQDLDEKIKNELGIDVNKYKNEEVAETFFELLLLPKYIFNTTVWPVIGAFIVYIIGFFVIDLAHFEYFPYGVFGFVLLLSTGFFGGMLFLIYRMKSDLFKIIEYSLDIMKSCIEDLNQVNQNITPENKKNVLGLLFKGVIHIVTVPMMTEVVGDKLPIVGRFIKGMIKSMLTLVSDKVKFDESMVKDELSKREEETGFIEGKTELLSQATDGLQKILSTTAGVAQFPLKIGFGISSILLFLLLYFIW